MKTYPITLEQIETLADALVQLDQPDASPHVRDLVERGHAALTRALGSDRAKVYDDGDNAAIQEAA